MPTILALPAALSFLVLGSSVYASMDRFESNCVPIEVAFVQEGKLHLAVLSRDVAEDRFAVAVAELPSAAPGELVSEPSLVVVRVSSDVGTKLMKAFGELGLSARGADYGYATDPPLSGIHNYGVIRCGDRQVVGCAITQTANASQRRESVKAAWWVQLIRSVAYQWREGTTIADSGVVVDALRRLLRELPTTLELPVCGGEKAQWQGSGTIDAGSLLRTAVARGLVYGNLVTLPEAGLEKDLRLAAIEHAAIKHEGNELEDILMRFIEDADADVRFKAAYELTGLVDEQRPEIRISLERYLGAETDAGRREWIRRSISDVEGAPAAGSDTAPPNDE